MYTHYYTRATIHTYYTKKIYEYDRTNKQTSMSESSKTSLP